MSFQKRIVILLALWVVLLGGAIFLWQSETKQRGDLPQKNTNVLDGSQPAPLAVWKKLESQGQALPVVQDQDLFIYSFTEKRLIPTGYHTFDFGGEIYMGSHDVRVSPDARYILFPNKDDNESLYLLSSETLEVRKITNGPVEYITDWSPDSKRFIYYIKNDSLSSRKVIEGMGLEILPWDKEERFSSGDSPGFHVFDIETGVDTHLFPLEGVEAFVDKEHVLAVAYEHVEGEERRRERSVIFDIDNFEADYTTFSKPIKFGQGQYSFTNDGKYWAFHYSNNPTNDANIIFAPFPSLTGTVIEASTWADVQNPKVSPQGKYVAYAKGVGFPKTRIWNAQTKKLVKELDGRPLHWLSEDRFVMKDPTTTSSSGPIAFIIYNLATDTSEVVPLDPKDN